MQTKKIFILLLGILLFTFLFEGCTTNEHYYSDLESEIGFEKRILCDISISQKIVEIPNHKQETFNILNLSYLDAENQKKSKSYLIDSEYEKISLDCSSIIESIEDGSLKDCFYDQIDFETPLNFYIDTESSVQYMKTEDIYHSFYETSLDITLTKEQYQRILSSK